MLLTISFILFCVFGIWNLVMMILFLRTRKSEGEKREKSRTGFLVSSMFFAAGTVFLIAAIVITEMFIEPIFYM